MLDVHPPHIAAHGWRDFFIHIATIVIGLLIAVGLEQAVEWLHRHHQVEQARETLRVEREKNIKLFALETRELEYYTPIFSNDMQVLRYLRTHPGAPKSSWPGNVEWGTGEIPFITAAWNTVQRDGVVEHLPPNEVEHLDELYKRLDALRAAELEERAQMQKAGSLYAQTDELRSVSPQELEKLIDATNDVLLAHARIGTEMQRVNRRFKDFTPAPDGASLRRLLGQADHKQGDVVDEQITRDFDALSMDEKASDHEE